jgi:photosystem II stability/assembly factor-like uncharacterized protein
MTSFRRTIATAVTGASIALVLAMAAGAAVPKAKWYWSLAVSNSDPNTLLLATSNGLYRSTNAGTTWQPVGPTGVNATSLAEAGNVVLMSGVHLAPGAKPVVIEKRTYLSGRGPGLLAASTDDGQTWHQLHPRGLPNLAIQALAADQAHAQVVYALLRTGALYRSSDSGHSFRLIAPRLGGPPWALAITRANHFLAGDMTTGPYLSTNGKQWSHPAFVDPKGGVMVMEYAVQPTNLKRILMTSYGVLMSTDSGQSWHVALKSKVMFGPVAWAPKASRVAYAVGWDRSLWRSLDGGASWTRVS